MAHPLFAFSNLTPSQRVDLAVALWDSLPADSEEPPITDTQRTELLRRADAYRRDLRTECSSSGMKWPTPQA